jgi:tetratricopeptide (TPR) repeat protein
MIQENKERGVQEKAKEIRGVAEEMDEIFLSYKSEDRPRAKVIADELERQGYSVWLDQKIPPGKTYDEFIKEVLDSSKCVVVLWSKESVKPKEGKWVRTEATIGDRRGILVPVLIDDVEPPIAFLLTEAAKLIDWDGTLPNKEFDLLLNSVAELVGRPPIQKNKIMGRSTPVATPTVSKTYSADEWYNKGIALDDQGRSQEALEAYDKVLEIDPQFKRSWNNKGYALTNLGRYQEAIEALDKALEIDPQYELAWNNKGRALDKLGRSQEALEAYDKALEIDPQSIEARYNKGLALDKLGRYQEALEAYDKALEIDPQYKRSWNNKGSIFDKLGRYQEALDAYDKALEIDPQYKLALDNKKEAIKKLRH